MKNVFFTSFFIVYTVVAAATIIEAPHFKDLKNHVTSDTLVLLDIDDTLLIPVQTLGVDVWFLHQLNSYKAAGYTANDALERALFDWESVRLRSEVQIVEEGTADIVKELQDQNITVMGLTTQRRTQYNLATLGIDLSRTAPSKEDFYFINGHGVLYRHGLLSTSGTVKGTALLKYLDHINYHPARIVFINDKATHLKDVETAVTSRGIEFIGLRYAYSDERVNSFRPEITDIQWNHSSFNHILSDEEAEELLSKTGELCQ